MLGPLQVAMDDALSVRGCQCLGDLLGERHSLIHGECPAGNALGECFPIDEFHDQEGLAFRIFEAMKCSYPRMVQRRQELRFALETGQLLRMLRELLGKDFDGDFTAKLGVASAVHLPHATGADHCEDLVLAELGSNL